MLTVQTIGPGCIAIKFFVIGQTDSYTRICTFTENKNDSAIPHN